jgi:hypothetical protein
LATIEAKRRRSGAQSAHVSLSRGAPFPSIGKIETGTREQSSPV